MDSFVILGTRRVSKWKKSYNLIQAGAGSENGDFRLSAPARPRDVPGAGRGAAGAPLGRVGAERRKSRVLGGVLVPLEGGLIVLILTLSYRSQKTED